MTYQPRFYRDFFSDERFRSFSFVVEESDLWVGVDEKSFCKAMPEFCIDKVNELRTSIKEYIKIHPEFGSSLSPLDLVSDMPVFAKEMICAGRKAGVGPMATVAGYVAGFLAKQILDKYQPAELVLENGGDIFAKVKRPLSVMIYAGDSPFSGKAGVSVPEGIYGICTSAGTVGHSYSQGVADGVMVACKDITLADAFATSIANKVKDAGCIDDLISKVENQKEILSCLIICGDKIGICGEFELICDFE